VRLCLGRSSGTRSMAPGDVTCLFMNRELHIVGLLAALLTGGGCAATRTEQPGAAGSSAEDPCERRAWWGRKICCGDPAETPGFSCVDEDSPMPPCADAGVIIDARIAQLHCCKGLKPQAISSETTQSFDGYPNGCGPSELPPSAAVCTACGDGKCERPAENTCVCPADCASDAGESSTEPE
jgi:hypothetical protein